MEPLHPPYGITQPRQLVRWEDVNSQNGKLSRTRGYFQFSLKGFADWNAIKDATHVLPNPLYPVRLFSYNFTAASKFSLSLDNVSLAAISSVPLGYSVYVMFVLQDGISIPNVPLLNKVVRYRLTPQVEDFLEAEQYTNQIILPKFTIEVYVIGPDSTYLNNFGVPYYKLDDLPNSLQFTTSVQGTTDYRYSTDFNIATLDSQCEYTGSDYQTVPFGVSPITLPITFNSPNRFVSQPPTTY